VNGIEVNFNGMTSYGIEVNFNGMTSLLNFKKIYSLVQEILVVDSQAYRRTDIMVMS
jgi:hypothetical protein